MAAKIASKLFIVFANWTEEKAKYRSSHWVCSARKCVCRNLAKLTRKQLCARFSFLKKLQVSGTGVFL